MAVSTNRGKKKCTKHKQEYKILPLGLTLLDLSRRHFYKGDDKEPENIKNRLSIGQK